jgi:hypothetical protein
MQRHHVHPDRVWVYVSGGGDGLVEPLRVGVGTEQHETEFCIRAWEQALAHACQAPLISNTDQGAQFTSPGFIDAVQSAGVEVSMDPTKRHSSLRIQARHWLSVLSISQAVPAMR